MNPIKIQNTLLVLITTILFSFLGVAFSIKSSLPFQINVESPGYQRNVGSSEPSPSYINALNSTGVLVTTSNTLVVSTSTARTLVRLTNLGPGIVFCSLNVSGTSTAVAATLYSGVTIMGSSTFEISPDNFNLYKGPVYCIATANSTTTVYQR